MKRVLALVLAALMLIGMLAGCAKETTPAPEETKTETKTGTKPEETKEPAQQELVPIRLFLAGNAFEVEEVEAVEAELNKISEPEIGVTVELTCVDSGAYGSQIDMMQAAGGTEFDICFTSSWLNDYFGAVSNGAYADITDMLHDVTPKLYDTINDYYWDGVTVDGRIYCVPNMQIAARAKCAIVPADLADEYGFDITKISTLADPAVDEYLEKVMADHPELTPLLPWDEYAVDTMESYFNDDPDFIQYSYTYGIDQTGAIKVLVYVDKDDPNMTVHCKTKEEVAADMLRYYELSRDRLEKGYYGDRETYLTEGIGDYDAKAAAKQYALFMETWKPGVDSESLAFYGYQTYSKRISPLNLDPGGLASSCLAISQACPYPEKALQVIELLNTNEEFYRLLGFGIQDRHYTLEDGFEQPISGCGYEPWDWGVGNSLLGYPLVGQDADVKQQTIDANNGAYYSPLVGFNPNLESVANAQIAYNDTATQFTVNLLTCEDMAAEIDARLEALWPYIEQIQNEVASQLQAYIDAM